MALFTPSESPAVVVKEVDLTSGVPNVQSSTGAYVGNFRWGPVEQRTLVSNEAGLAETFASPDTLNNRNIDFISATQFLRYSNSLQVVRAVDSAAKNARAQTTSTGRIVWNGLGDSAQDSPGSGVGVNRIYNFSTATNPTNYDDSGIGASNSFTSRLTIDEPLVKNKTNFDESQSALDSDLHTFVARFPGDLGNSLRVSIFSDSAAAFDNWTYKSSFDGRPGTSEYAINRDGIGDEIHVAVVDLNGTLTGTKGTVLETYPYVSVASDAKNNDGSTNYVIDVINERSEYVHMVQFDSAFATTNNAGTALTPGTAKTFLDSNVRTVNYDFDSGVNSGTLGTAQYATGFDLFEDKDQVEVDFLIAPGMTTTTDQTTVVNDLISTAGTVRKDCVAVTSPARDDVVNLTNAATITSNITATADTFTNSSYLIMDGNYLKVYDKFNDVYVQVPAASSTAGIMAATDRNAAPWFSPAGGRRGQYLGITAIDYQPTKAQRDTLYKASVNPVANIPGQGVILFGDKTGLNRPSAFDRINVRRLFLVLERAISRAAENVLFEFNDEFTRAEFVNIIEPVLREVKGRRGITDFSVVCNETNNTQAVIDRNEFIASIFIKPARSVNYITLNFVAVRTGVDFEEVVGTV
jgi:phage tail sheath protein FI